MSVHVHAKNGTASKEAKRVILGLGFRIRLIRPIEDKIRQDKTREDERTYIVLVTRETVKGDATCASTYARRCAPSLKLTASIAIGLSLSIVH